MPDINIHKMKYRLVDEIQLSNGPGSVLRICLIRQLLLVKVVGGISTSFTHNGVHPHGVAEHMSTASSTC